MYFTRKDDVHWLERLDSPEAAVAYDQDYVTRLVEKCGFARQELYPGNWCGRPRTVEWQDVIVAR